MDLQTKEESLALLQGRNVKVGTWVWPGLKEPKWFWGFTGGVSSIGPFNTEDEAINDALEFTSKKTRTVGLPSLEELREAQLRAWPDSKLDVDPWDWVDQEAEFRDDDNMHTYENIVSGSPTKDDAKLMLARNLDAERANSRRLQRQVTLLHSLLLAYAGFFDGTGLGLLFYECGLKDGTYQWRGARYGVEPEQYMGGFGRL